MNRLFGWKRKKLWRYLNALEFLDSGYLYLPHRGMSSTFFHRDANPWANSKQHINFIL